MSNDTISFASQEDNNDTQTASEFDGQIAEIENNIGKVKSSIKESEECARRLTEQRAELKSLQEQKDHLEKEKEKKILEDKLSKQMRDLNEINRMSRVLRQKYNEMKHTQQLMKTRMSESGVSLGDLQDKNDAAMEEVAAQIDAMHAAQLKILEASHK